VAAPRVGQPYDFPGIAVVGRIDSWRANISKPAKQTVRYFLASRPLSAKKLLDVVRAHWGIENNLYWVLDVLFAEDACRTRKDHAPENLAVIRKLAINILQATPALFASATKCSKLVGTTTSFSPLSPICDSPTR
jgi:predicted transposase YbfD/YdcC